MADSFGFTADPDSIPNPLQATHAANLGFQPDPTPVTTPATPASSFGFQPTADATPAATSKGGWVWSAVTTDKELEDIANKHGINPQDIKDIAGYFGATKENENVSDLVKQAAGGAGEAVGLGLPQKIYKRLQNPNMESALDDLSELAERKKSTLRTAAELFGGVGTAGLTSALGPLALPVMGAAAGYSHARAGEELPATAIGAVAAPVIGKAVEAVAPYVGRAASAIGEKLGFIPEAASDAAAGAVAKAPEVDVGGADITRGGAGIEDIVNQRLQGEAGRTLDAEKAALKSGDPKDLVDFLGGSEQVTKYIEPSSTEYKVIVNELREEGTPVTRQNIAEKVADAKLESLRDDIATRVGADDWEQAVKEKGGINYLVDSVYNNMAKENIAVQAIKEANLGKNVRSIGTIEGMGLKLADDKPVMKIIDKRFGGGAQFSAEQAVDDISENTAKYAPKIRDGLQQLVGFDNSLKQAGLSREDFSSLFRRGQAPEELTNQWNTLTKGLLDTANDEGAGIEARTNYMRDQILPPRELMAAVQDRTQQLSNKYNMDITDLTEQQFNSLKSSPDFAQLVKAVDMAGGEAKDVVGFTNGLKTINEDAVRNASRLYSSLSAAKSKVSEIPDFIREPDPVRGMQSWLASTYKDMAVKEPLDRLRSLANIADKAGDSWTAKHLRDKIQDVLGVRKDSLAGGTRQIFNQWSSYWNGKGYPSVAEMPELFRGLIRNQYANLIGGLNIKLSLQHMATPALSGIPDVGIVDGTRAWWNSLGAIRSTLLKEGPAGLRAILEENGMIVPHLDREALQLGEKGPGKLNEMSNHALMFTFRMSELIGRGQAYFMGQDLGARIAANPEWGAKFVSRLNSPGYRRVIAQAMKDGDVQTIKDQMSRYLNSNHLLNYDRAHQSAFARYAGPMFTAFQKWPSTMYGKVAQELYDKGIVGGSTEVAKKILAPTLALGIVDQFYQPTPRGQKIVGHGLASMTGGAEMLHFAPLHTPIQGVLGDIGEAIIGHKRGTTEDQSLEDKLRSAANTAAVTFLPYAGWLKMFGEDLPQLIYDKKPEGLPLERRIETIGRGFKP